MATAGGGAGYEDCEQCREISGTNHLHLKCESSYLCVRACVSVCVCVKRGETEREREPEEECKLISFESKCSFKKMH